MAYHARIDKTDAQPIALPPSSGGMTARPEFSTLEWSIIRLARVDGLSTIRAPGPLRRFYNFLIGRTGSPMLANPRLEALRRIAVLSWHFGFSVPGDDVADFLAEGFTADQYELLVSSVRRASTPPIRTIAKEAFA
jgi:hypothetical protein